MCYDGRSGGKLRRKRKAEAAAQAVALKNRLRALGRVGKADIAQLERRALIGGGDERAALNGFEFRQRQAAFQKRFPRKTAGGLIADVLKRLVQDAGGEDPRRKRAHLLFDPVTHGFSCEQHQCARERVGNFEEKHGGQHDDRSENGNDRGEDKGTAQLVIFFGQLLRGERSGLLFFHEMPPA